jgi:hypothetical protein
MKDTNNNNSIHLLKVKAMYIGSTITYLQKESKLVDEQDRQWYFLAIQYLFEFKKQTEEELDRLKNDQDDEFEITDADWDIYDSEDF